MVRRRLDPSCLVCCLSSLSRGFFLKIGFFDLSRGSKMRRIKEPATVSPQHFPTCACSACSFWLRCSRAPTPYRSRRFPPWRTTSRHWQRRNEKKSSSATFRRWGSRHPAVNKDVQDLSRWARRLRANREVLEVHRSEKNELFSCSILA